MELGVFVASGNTADIYLSKNHKYAIKLFNDRFGMEVAQVEARKQKTVYDYATNFRVPKIVDVLSIEARPAIIMEYLSGKDLAEKMLLDSNPKQLIREFVALQNKVHQTNVLQEKLPLLTDTLFFQIEQAHCLMEIQKKNLLNGLLKMNISHALCHGDFHPQNVLCHKREYAIIDWLDAAVGDAFADVCRSYLILLQNAPEIAPLYLDVFCEENAVSKENIYKWMPFIAAARLGENLPETQQQQLLQILSKSDI